MIQVWSLLQPQLCITTKQISIGANVPKVGNMHQHLPVTVHMTIIVPNLLIIYTYPSEMLFKVIHLNREIELSKTNMLEGSIYNALYSSKTDFIASDQNTKGTFRILLQRMPY